MKLFIIAIVLLFGGKSFADSSITKADYDLLRNKIYQVFSPITDKLNRKLTVSDRWKSTIIDAVANRYYDVWTVEVSGELARHKEINFLGLATIFCHEMGHHVAGEPLKPKFKTYWASTEGQADYFVGTKCFNLIFSADERLKWLDENSKTIDPEIKKICELAHEDINRRISCMRAIYGGLSAIHFFKRKYKKQPTPMISTPSNKVVKKTHWKHSVPQCRLDTFVEAALCDLPVDPIVSIENLGTGYCNRKMYIRGVRPLCWYKP